MGELLDDDTADGVEHELDFTLLRADAVYTYIRAHDNSKIATIQNPTLFKSLANHVNNLRTE